MLQETGTLPFYLLKWFTADPGAHGNRPPLTFCPLVASSNRDPPLPSSIATSSVISTAHQRLFAPNRSGQLAIFSPLTERWKRHGFTVTPVGVLLGHPAPGGRLAAHAAAPPGDHHGSLARHRRWWRPGGRASTGSTSRGVQLGNWFPAPSQPHLRGLLITSSSGSNLLLEPPSF